MKKTLISIFLTLLLISTLCLSNTFAQDYRKLDLPEGAKLRLGKGWISGNIEYSPNGHRIAVASSVGIWIYNANTYAEVALLTGHTGPVRSVAFSPDSKKLVSGGDDGAARLWDVRTGQLLRTYKGHTAVTRAFRANEGQAVPVRSVTFSPDGKTIASGGDDEDVVLWATDTGQLLHNLTLRSPGAFYLLGGPDPIYSVAFSPDGSKVVNTNGSYIYIWDVTTGKPLMKSTDTSSSSLYSVKFSSDGIILATGSSHGKVQLWGARTGKLWQTLRRSRISRDDVNSVAFSPDGKILVSSGSDDTVDFWDTSTGEHLRTLHGHTSSVLGVSFSPNGRTIVSVSWTEIRFWNADTGRQKHIITGHTNSIHSVSFSPDGRTLATGDFGSNIHLWNANTGAHKQTLTGHTATVRSVAFSPDGNTLASGSFDETVRLWDVATSELKQTLTRHGDAVQVVAFSPDGNTLASGDQDDIIRLWDVATGELQQYFDTGSTWVYSIDFSPDGATLVEASAGKSSGDIELWHLRTNRRLKYLVRSSDTYTVTFSPDGSTIAGGAKTDVMLWDTRSGELLHKLTGHTGRILNVAFSPDGETLATTGSDRTVRLWNARTGSHLRTLRGHMGLIFGLDFSPDGSILASGSNDGTVMLWQLTPSGHRTPQTNLTVDVNGDGKINKTDLLRVVKVLGKKSTKKIRVDVNGDGLVDVADLLLVIEHLDNPEVAAAPANRENVASLNPAMLSAYLDLLRAQNDGTLAYAQVISFLENLLAAAKPESTLLLANYPNPFNPETWIPYQLAGPGEVMLTIYAVNGTLIRTLALGHQPAGRYHSRSRAAYWDGCNEAGEPVASGVYFYMLTVGDFTATRKMSILK